MGAAKQFEGEARALASSRPRQTRRLALVAAFLVLPVLTASPALAQEAPVLTPQQEVAPPADPPPTPDAPKPDPSPPPPPPKAKPKPPPPPPPAAVISPPPASPPPPAPTRVTPKPKVQRGKKPAKRKVVRSKPKLPVQPTLEELPASPEPEPAATPAPAPAAAKKGSDLMTSPLVRLLLMTAASLAVLSMLLAALPLPALERILSAEAHYRTEQVATFVDGHRLDIVVGGVATLLVALVVALPTVTG